MGNREGQPQEAMGLEGPDKQKEGQFKTIQMTEAERNLLARGAVDDEKVIELMKQKGIEFDSGDVILDVDGKKEMMTTDRNDFGTQLIDETIEERYGKDALDLLK